MKDESGAIAPLYALALFGLIGMAGVGFDYARVMALDTELQNAADQMALAAATQLDHQTDSITRANGAVSAYFASTATDKFNNQTRLSNIDDDGDGKTRFVTKFTTRYWEDYDHQKDEPLKEISGTSDGSKADYVEVTLGNRLVRYALTPIVGAIVGRAGASAMATMSSAYCKLPPLMTCQPYDNFGAAVTDPTTGTVSVPDKGRGLMLHFLANGKTTVDASSAVPGLFGFLDFPYPQPDGVKNSNTSLGWEVDNAGCVGQSATTEPGVRTPEQVALNTRFGFSDKGYVDDCADNGTFCPAKNVNKDMVVAKSFNNASLADIAAISCPATAAANANFVKDDSLLANPYNATTGTGYVDEKPAGYSRDACHISGGCTVNGVSNSIVGDKNWNFDEYMRKVHGVSSASSSDSTTWPSGLGGNTRYDVYKWENDSGYPSRLNARRVGYNISSSKTNKGVTTYSGDVYCAYPKPHNGTGVEPPTVKKDRRVLQVASVDCSGLKGGRSDVDLIRYIDVFLTEPAYDGTSRKEFYAEIIGEDVNAGKSTNFQKFAKRKAVLVR